jgi:tripartite-type tricarboxylate transporter receptor subunit TctC
MHVRLRFVIFSMALSCGAAPGTVLAQNAADKWPAKPVQVVMPFGPGGSTEVEGRLYSQKLTDQTGQPFVLDFRPGAGSTIGINYVAKAAPDGYTILINTAALTITPAIYKDLPYDPVKDIAPVTLISKRPSVLAVHPSLPIRTPAEYIAYAKAHPGELNYGTTGAGGSPHMAGAWLHSLTGTKATFVHYKGTGTLMPDLLAGRLQVTTNTFASLLPHIKSGKLRVIGVTTAQRSPLMPELPAIGEQGAPGYDYSSWLGFVTTAATPPAIINKLRGELVKVAADPDVNKKLGAEGITMVANTPEEFRQFIAVEMTRWRKLVQETGMKIEE